ncbi:MAG TPA: NAD-dependent epimerase/dehydratase family protein [Acidobacteriaceae bacterium]
MGATGSLGRALGLELSLAGRPYRAVSRSALALQVRFPPERAAEPVVWDPEEQASIRHALQGVDTAVYMAGVPLWEFAKHLALTRRVLEAATQTGVRRLLLVSSNWAYGLPEGGKPVTEAHALAAHTVKGRVRAEQEQAVLAAHSAGVLETAVLRVADFYGPQVEASYLWSAFRAAKQGTRAQVMQPADRPHEFVFVPDAARTVLHMLDQAAVWGRAWNLGGAGPVTLRAMVEAIFAEAGRAPFYEVAPGWKLGLIRMMNPYVRELKEMQYLLETPVFLDDAALSGTLGGLTRTPYSAGIRQTLAPAGR